MAKKTPVKKSKRRLKRSVRRSLAAVLMITAIGVAAIPVPENYAAPDDDNPSATADAYDEQYKEIGDRESSTNVVYSLSMYERASGKELFWQYKIDKTTDMVIEYNSQYPETNLTLDDYVYTDYTYVTETEFNSILDVAYTLYANPDSGSYYQQVEAISFFEDYFADDQDYKDFKDALNSDDPIPSITKGVSNMSDEQKGVYYCRTKFDNPLENYTLEYVRIQIKEAEVLTQKGLDQSATGVYIPKYIGTDNSKTQQDANGYRLKTVGSVQSIAAIGAYAFAGNGILINIELPEWITEIGEGAFMECTHLESVNIPFLKEISNAAFKGCYNLSTVNWWMSGASSKLSSIGVEAFYGTGITESTSGQRILKFPNSIKKIDNAAFYECKSLSQIEFEGGNVAINEYAFYDNTALNSVTFNNAGVSSLGDYCLAIGGSQNSMTAFTFPNSSVKLGKKILENRDRLSQITVPEGVGHLGAGILDGCTGLTVATFEGPDTSYDSALFNSVMMNDFYVTGPARKTSNATTDNVKDASNPRRSTWDAEKTAAGNYIPYLYKIGNNEYYEICSGEGYLESIDKNSGTLTSCDVRDDIPIQNGGELVIPDVVGTTPVRSIASDCFKGKTKLANSVGSLVIGNNLLKIENSVFDSWTNLTKVEIGKSIQTIGSGAFANCTSLEDITFVTPDSYETLSELGTDAFATNSGRLTIHGDIVEGYLPYEYAVNPNNYVNASQLVGASSKYRILYQSRWDSPSSKHMSVIYGEYDDGNGYVTLVDYPIYQDFYATDNEGNLQLSKDLQEHNRDMETQYYRAYGNFAYPTEDDPYLKQKVEFAYDYYKYIKENNEAALKSLYENESMYGPWINPNFCSNYMKWLDSKWLEQFGKDSLTTGAANTVYDLFFAPMTVMAAEDDSPKPYFEKYHYNFLENYMEAQKETPSHGTTPIYRYGWTQDELAMIEAVEKVVIPAGVESIDLAEYMGSTGWGQQNVVKNSDNYYHYFGDTYSAVDRGNTFVVYGNSKDTGLFSGKNINDLYDDGGTIDQGDNRRGNDRIKSIDMSQSNVQWIPDYAFDNCELLEEVLIPASCTTTGALPFRDCGNMKYLTSASEEVPALNGILYQKKSEDDGGGYELVECILGKDVDTVNATNDDPYISQVTSIGESAFENCNGIRMVDLSTASKLRAIPDKCFKNCDNLREVSLPVATNEVGQESFAYIREDYPYIKESDMPRLNITIRGTEFNFATSAFDPKREKNDDGQLESTIDMVTIWTYEDTAAERYVLEQQKLGYDIRLGDEGPDHNDHQYINQVIRVYFKDYNGDFLNDTAIYLKENVNRVYEEDIPAEVTEIVTAPNHHPGYTFTGWRGDGGQLIGDIITTSVVVYTAQYESDGTMVNGKYVLVFLDGIDGSRLSGRHSNEKDGLYYIEPGTSFMSNGWKDEMNNIIRGISHEGYEFLEWSNNWTENTVIDRNMTIVALFKAMPTSGGSTNTPGTGSSGGSTNTPGGTTSGGTTSGTTTSSSTNTTSSSTSSSSTSTSSTSSGSDSTVGKYTVTVINGSGSGNYDVGSTVVIAANEPAAGMVFQKWTTESNGVALASVSLPATTFTMPANNVTVTAEFVAGANNITGAVGTPAGNTGTTNTGSTNTGNTRVDITKPGISNRDLATANVNGSTDNFIVKITETDEATRAVQDALTNKYGSLENLLYYAMDISLYDSTGTVKISDTTGLSVDITIPIPDALVAYGGNNMAGAVINGNQLENLNESFTTINGVPCIRFRATHFSPYTVYVDTGNLTEGMLDTTPKTGDPIHPKWFLSIGLACLSVILFMKKDKAVKVKTA